MLSTEFCKFDFRSIFNENPCFSGFACMTFVWRSRLSTYPQSLLLLRLLSFKIGTVLNQGGATNSPQEITSRKNKTKQSIKQKITNYENNNYKTKEQLWNRSIISKLLNNFINNFWCLANIFIIAKYNSVNNHTRSLPRCSCICYWADNNCG